MGLDKSHSKRTRPSVDSNAESFELQHLIEKIEAQLDGNDMRLCTKALVGLYIISCVELDMDLDQCVGIVRFNWDQVNALVQDKKNKGTFYL